MSATVNPESFGVKAYNFSVKNSPSFMLLDKTISKLALANGDTKNIVILKAAAFKAAMIPILGLSVVESIAKLALGLVSFLFSILTWPISSTLSNKSYQFANDLLRCNYALYSMSRSFRNFIYA